MNGAGQKGGVGGERRERAVPVMLASPSTLAAAVLPMMALPQPKRLRHLQPAAQAQLAS